MFQVRAIMRIVGAALGATVAAGTVAVGFVSTASGAGDANRATCPNEANAGFRPYLADCRAYEMVTPPYKQGYPVNVQAVAEEGSPAIGWSWGVFSGATGPPQARAGGTTGSEYEFARSATGWTTVPLSPQNTRYEDVSSWWATSADLSQTLWSMPTAPVGQEDFYARRPDGSFLDLGPKSPPADGPVVPPAPQGSGPGSDFFPFQGASGDLSHLLFGIAPVNALDRWPGDSTVEGGENLYEYVGAGNSAPVMVGVSGGPGSTSLIGQCGVRAGGRYSAYNALSFDGSTVVFSPVGADEESCAGTQPAVVELYARVNQSQTLKISARSAIECVTVSCQGSPASDALFEGASSDGSKVFFASTQQLTDQASEDATSGDSADKAVGTGCPEAHESGCNLYEYDFGSPAGRNLLVASKGSASPHVQGVVRIAQSGSLVYFVAQGVLTAAPNSQGQTAQLGADNFYVFERDARFPQGRTTFIAALAPSDEELWGGSQNFDLGRPAQSSPDGRFLVFQSHADLTVDDTSSAAWQAFEYDAQTGALIRVSRGQGGFNHDGNTSADSATIPAPNFGSGQGGDTPRPLALSNDGSYVVFESADGLTPQALNDVTIDNSGHKASNVYEYHNGEVFLISDGQDISVAGNGTGSNVKLIGTSSSGRDVFFTTGDRLLAEDVDTQQDIYDARIEGGFPALVQSFANCQGETCQGALSAAPLVRSPATAIRSNAGNLAPPPPAHGKPKTPAQIRAERLVHALRACRAKHNRKQRVACEAKARRRYGSRSHGSISKSRRAR
jgi:hypothetical protein